MTSSKLLNVSILDSSLQEIIINLIRLRDQLLNQIRYEIITETEAKIMEKIEEKVLEIEKQIATLDRSQFTVGDKVYNMGLVGTLLDIYLEPEPNPIDNNKLLLYKVQWDDNCNPKFAGKINSYYIFNLIRINPNIKYQRIGTAALLQEISQKEI